MPWVPIRNMDGIMQQWKNLPTFLICEYVMYLGTLLAFIHARFNSSLDLWYASWICGTANDIFFMFLPFCDNFWQAQATIMLTPRLPLYIVCMYVVLIYFSNTAARRYGLKSPLAESMLTGLLAAVLYGVYDLNGPRYLWWTWHDSDAAIYERLGGAPIGSTMWILTYSCLCNLLFRWCSRNGFHEITATTKDVILHFSNFKTLNNPSIQAMIFKITNALDRWQEKKRSGPIALLILFVCCACTPLFMILLGQFSIFSLDIAGKPGIRTLTLTCLVFVSVVVMRGLCHSERQPSISKIVGSNNQNNQRCCYQYGSGGFGDVFIGWFLIFWFVLHLWMMVSFDSSTHISTGVHQTYAVQCDNSSLAYDIMGFERLDSICGVGPIDASKMDYKLCLQEVGTEGILGSDTEWYSVCGVENELSIVEMNRMVLLVVIGIVGYSKAFFFS